jgi:hypothetical protein
MSLDITEPPASPNETKEQREYRIRTHADQYWTLRNKLISRTAKNSTLSVIASFVSLMIALTVVVYTTSTQKQLTAQALKAQRELKEIDLRQFFLKRYEEIVFDQREKVESLPANTPKEILEKKARSYYHRFWDLQLEEYQFRCSHLIDERIYSSWMDFRYGEFRENADLQGINYRTGWEEAKDYFSKREPQKKRYYTNFIGFMDKVFNGETTADPNCPE